MASPISPGRGPSVGPTARQAADSASSAEVRLGQYSNNNNNNHNNDNTNNNDND